MDGTARNWPIPMVVQAQWVATYYPDTFTYQRDNIAIPQAMDWLDGDWQTPGQQLQRTDFENEGMPAAMGALFGLREDIEIIMA